MCEIVLDPELRAGLLDKSLYRRPARERLIAVELESWGFVRVAFFLIVIQVARQQDRPGLMAKSDRVQISHVPICVAVVLFLTYDDRNSW
jgi:hypothetical protein